MPEFYYRPYGMEFLDYEIGEMTSFAKIEYRYENQIISLHIDKQDDETASNISSLNGDEQEEIVKSEDGLQVLIKTIEDAGDISSTCAAMWTSDGVTYYMSGKIELDEIKKIIKYMKN